MDNEMVTALRQMMREEIQEVIQPINDRLDSLKTDVAGLKTDVAGLKTDVSDLKKGQADQAEFERGTRVLVEGMNKNIKLLAEGQSASISKLQQLDRIEATLNDVKSDTQVIKDVVSWHSGDLNNLKQA